MRILGLGRCAVGLGAAAGLLAGCGTVGVQSRGVEASQLMQTRSSFAPATLSVTGRERKHAPTRRASSGYVYVYVSNVTTFGPPASGEVVYYPAGSNGNVAPSGAIAGSNTDLTLVDGIVVDDTGEIYVANSDTNSIVGFPAGSNGNVSPNLVISGSETGLASPIALALDRLGNLYVSNCGECDYGPPGKNSIEEFAAGSNGNVNPIREITGKRTQLGHVNQLAIDRAGKIYVANVTNEATLVFNRNANGNASPVRVLAGTRSRINEPDGLAIGPAGLYVTSVYSGYIGRFPLGAGGDESPRVTLHVDWSNGGQQVIGGIIVAPDDSLYVTGFSVPLVAQNAERARGKEPPLTVIQGSATQLVTPTFVFVK